MTSQIRSDQFSSRSCARCYQRKVKCDRQRPCSNCMKLGDVCIVPNTPIRRQRRKKRADESHRPSDISRDGASSDTLDNGLNSYPLFDGNPFIKHLQLREPERCWMPTFDQIQTSWRIYTRNIDPFLRILHKPSVYRLIMQVKGQELSILCEEELALILSICFASVTSLTTEQCISTFGQNRVELYELSRNSAEMAMWRAGLLQKPDIRTLQAFTIILVRYTVTCDE
jgi:Zn(2)-Cys(6) binuclear cluster domain-containing protein